MKLSGFHFPNISSLPLPPPAQLQRKGRKGTPSSIGRQGEEGTEHWVLWEIRVAAGRCLGRVSLGEKNDKCVKPSESFTSCLNGDSDKRNASHSTTMRVSIFKENIPLNKFRGVNSFFSCSSFLI